MTSARRDESKQEKVAQYVLFGVLNDAINLAHRFKESEVLQHYVLKRLALVVPMALLIVVASIACTAATVLYLAGNQSFLLLLALLLIPVVLLGSLFVQAYVFVSWLEERALASAYPHHQRPPAGPVAAQIKRYLKADMGARPPVPWVLAAIVFFLPMLLFVLLSPKLAFLLIALLVAAPVAYAVLDR